MSNPWSVSVPGVALKDRVKLIRRLGNTRVVFIEIFLFLHRFKDAPVGSTCTSTVQELSRISHAVCSGATALEYVSLTHSLSITTGEILQSLDKMNKCLVSIYSPILVVYNKYYFTLSYASQWHIYVVFMREVRKKTDSKNRYELSLKHVVVAKFGLNQIKYKPF